MTTGDGVSEGTGRPEAADYSEGFLWEGDDPQELRECLEAAFDYRGNVTLLLRGAESQLEGYLSNRDFGCGTPFIDLFPADGGSRRRLPLETVRGVAFTGKDTAAGKSWQTWIKKYESKKAAASGGLETDAIGLYPDPLD